MLSAMMSPSRADFSASGAASFGCIDGSTRSQRRGRDDGRGGRSRCGRQEHIHRQCAWNACALASSGMRAMKE
jgi:hypothetical protein